MNKVHEPKNMFVVSTSATPKSFMERCTVIILCICTIGIGIHADTNKTNGKKIVASSATHMTFPEAFPGDTFLVRKYTNQFTGEMWIESDCGRIKSYEDIQAKRKENERIYQEKWGAITPELKKRLASASDTSMFEVHVEPAWNVSDYTWALDKTKHGPEELRTHTLKSMKEMNKRKRDALTHLKTEHVIEMARIKNRHKPSTSIYTLSKKDILNLAKKGTVASLEPWEQPEVCVAPGGSCGEVGANRNIETLAFSSYNEEYRGQMTSLGQGVNAATIEFAELSPEYVTLLLGDGYQFGRVDTGYDLGNGTVGHCHATFGVLRNTAPEAKLHYYKDISYTFADSTFIVDNEIHTISRSTTGGGLWTTIRARAVDKWAYRYPYPVIVVPTANKGHSYEPSNLSFNALSVGNVIDYSEWYFMMPWLTGLSAAGIAKDTCTGGETQTRNPPGFSGHTITQGLNFSSCDGSTNDRGDWELPHVVAAGISPYYNSCCVQDDRARQAGIQLSAKPGYDENLGGACAGTSLSAPAANGLAACIISSNDRMKHWPEKVRCAMILTAHNVHGGHFDPVSDGVDGTGTLAGIDAVDFARNHSAVGWGHTNPVETGLAVGSLYPDTAYRDLHYKIQVPSTLPSGRHLRIVALWDGSPSMTSYTNTLADLDIVIPSYPCPTNGNNINWGTWDSNVEAADIPNSALTPGQTIDFFVRAWPFNIQADAIANYIYYAVGWEWVRDHTIEH